METLTVKDVKSEEPFGDSGLFPTTYAFTNNTVGVAYHKSEIPFPAGSEVSVEVTGKIKGGPQKGINKLKVKKPDDGSYSNQSSGAPRSTGQQNRIQGHKRDGMQVGNAVNNATLLITSGVIKGEGKNPLSVELDEISHLIWDVTSKILLAVDQIEAGNLAGRPVDIPKDLEKTNPRPTKAQWKEAEDSIQYGEPGEGPEQPEDPDPGNNVDADEEPTF